MIKVMTGKCLIILIELASQSIFEAASPQAEKIRSLTYGFIIAGAGVLLLVVSLTVFITVKFRVRNSSAEPQQQTGNRKLEMVMVGVPLILIIVFFFWSISTMNAVLPGRNNRQPDIVITGHQWWWQASYSGTNVVTANEIHLPTGRKLLMQLDAADVIHDWWVPAFGGKMDMIPGRNNYLWLTINKPGVYDGTCSEFCGQQHAWMRIKVIAQLVGDYNNWLQAQAKNTTKPSDTVAQAGEALFMKASCSSCHSIRGTLAAGSQGPDLTHFAGRETILAGLMDNNRMNLTRWLSDPQTVKPGAHMPRFIFSKDSIRVLTAYLSQLK